MVADHLGLIGLELIALVLKVIIFLLVTAAMDAPPLTRAWLTLSSAVVAYPVIAGARPQLLSYLSLAVVSLWVHRTRQGHRSRPDWMPLLFLLWANIHSFYPIGLALLTVVVLGDRINKRLGWRPILPDDLWRRLATVLIVCCLSCFVTPYGPASFRQVVRNVVQSAGLPIEEWQPLARSGHAVSVFLSLLLVLWVASASLTEKKPDAVELAIGFFTTLSALSGIRMVGLWSILMAPFLAEHIRFWTEKRQPDPRSLLSRSFAPVSLFLTVLILTVKSSPAAYLRAERATYPAKASAVVSQRVALTEPVRCLTLYHWGGYVAWKLYPLVRIFVDGRADYYPKKVMQEYLEMTGGGPRWRRLLERYQVNAVLLPPRYPLISLLKQDNDWKEAFRDRVSVLFIRRSERDASK